jgi:hypothetical protein
MHLGAGTLFVLVLAYGLFHCFPRLAKALVMLACVGVVGFTAYVIYDDPHLRKALLPAWLQPAAIAAPAPQPGIDVEDFLRWRKSQHPFPTEEDAQAHYLADKVLQWEQRPQEAATATPDEAAATVRRLRQRVGQ